MIAVTSLPDNKQEPTTSLLRRLTDIERAEMLRRCAEKDCSYFHYARATGLCELGLCQARNTLGWRKCWKEYQEEVAVTGSRQSG